MTTTHESGSKVPGGYYLDAASWHVAPVAEGERLPAGAGRWLRIPTPLAVALAPILGAAFVVLLPFIGIFVTLEAIASVMAGVFHRSATDLAATVSPGWHHGEAHFAGRRGSPSADQLSPTREDVLDALEAEIRRRRNLSK
jgi:hypothetical protein